MIANKIRGYLVSAVRKLGPERAYDALRAYENDSTRGCGDDEGWDGCVLARAYGPPGDLNWRGDSIQLERRKVGAPRSGASLVAAEILGLADRELIAVVRSYDGDWGEPYSELLKYLLVKEAGKLSTPREESLELVSLSAGRRSEGGE